MTRFGGKAPMSRPGQPEEIAPSYVFFGYDDSSYISGQYCIRTAGKSSMDDVVYRAACFASEPESVALDLNTAGALKADHPKSADPHPGWADLLHISSSTRIRPSPLPSPKRGRAS